MNKYFNMKNIYLISSVLVYCLFVVPTLIVSIASYVIGIQNMDTICDGPFIKLSTWLIISSTFNLVAIVLFTLLAYLFFTREKFCYVVMFFVLYGFMWLLTLFWNIMGAVELFKYAEDCRLEAEHLWIMVLVSLICQWLGICLTCCIKRVSNSKVGVTSMDNVLERQIEKRDNDLLLPINNKYDDITV